VGRIVARVVQRMSPADRLGGLQHIGVDELSYRRHHKYITIITDHDSGRVVWAQEGKSAATLDAFFAELGPTRCAQLLAVTLDLSQAYIQSVKAHAPNAVLVFDRFHVRRLAHDALDQVRRQLVAAQEGRVQRRALKDTRFVLQKNPENLTGPERQKLAHVQATIDRSTGRIGSKRPSPRSWTGASITLLATSCWTGSGGPHVRSSSRSSAWPRRSEST
jgi:transposase